MSTTMACFNLIDDFGDEFVSPYITAEYSPNWRYYWTSEDYELYEIQSMGRPMFPGASDMRNSPQCWFKREWMCWSVVDANNYPGDGQQEAS